MRADAVRDKFLLALIVVVVTFANCSMAYEMILRVAPWMVGKV